MTKTKEQLFRIAMSRNVMRDDLIGRIRELGISDTFTPDKWDEYIGVVDTLVEERILRDMRKQVAKRCELPPAVPGETFGEACARKLRMWSERKWLFYPVKRTPDWKYVKDPDDTVEGELIYPGVLNE